MLDRLIATLVTLGAVGVAIRRYRILNKSYDRTRLTARSDRSFRYLYGPLILVACAASVAAYWNRGESVLQSSRTLRLIGSALIAGGISGFEWSVRALGSQYSPSFDLRVPTVRVKTGPYRWLSHPIYVSNCAILYGAALASGSALVIATALIISRYYVRAASTERGLLEAMHVRATSVPKRETGACLPQGSSRIGSQANEGDKMKTSSWHSIIVSVVWLGLAVAVRASSPPAGYSLWETLSVPIDGSSIASSNLKPGVNYVVRVSGAAAIAGLGMNDADYDISGSGSPLLLSYSACQNAGAAGSVTVEIFAPAVLLTSGCVANPTTLCLAGGRFAASAMWTSPGGAAGPGMAVPLTPDTGAFWFFDASNYEMMVKALDACSQDGKYWVFAAGLTNVAVALHIVDTMTGATREYRNIQGSVFVPIEDTSAFVCGSQTAAWTARVFNIDDEMTIVLNGRTLATEGICQDSGLIALPLVPGTNTVEIDLQNGPSGAPGLPAAIAFSYEIRRNGSVIETDSCGQACQQGCNSNANYPVGTIFRRVFTIEN